MDEKSDKYISRRNFVKISAITFTGSFIGFPLNKRLDRVFLKPDYLSEGIFSERHESPLENGTWYQARNIGDYLEYTFQPGTLSMERYLFADMLLPGKVMTAFMIELREAENGPAFQLNFKLLNECQARVRIDLGVTDLNIWKLPREGAWLKPLCGGDRVDLEKVDRMRLIVYRKIERPVKWCITPFEVVDHEPVKISQPILTKGLLLDELGQSMLHQWPGKTASVDILKNRLQKQLKDSAKHTNWPANFAKWGGDNATSFDATGYFRTYHDGKKWWLIDPDGHPFWSAGLDVVKPGSSANISGIENALTWMPPPGGFMEAYGEDGPGGGEVNFVIANFIRTFGSSYYPKWSQIALGELKKLGFNTVGNWSDWEVARKNNFPYVRPLSYDEHLVPRIYRDFPDVFHPDFDKETEIFAKQLASTRDDKALIGYFLMNEPRWGFSSELPAAGMLYNSDASFTAKQFAGFLAGKYNLNNSDTWHGVSLEKIGKSKLKMRLPAESRVDLLEFSSIMVEKFFGSLSAACKKADPNHLNLGARYHTTPPEWTLAGMKSFDIFSMNCYKEMIPAGEIEKVSVSLNSPVIIGEFHFGALDVGLPSSGIGHVKNQEERGMAYRRYVEHAAVNPHCVGTHWFYMYDQSAMGRYDGENYNIGFFDVCNKPYLELGRAARLSHENMYHLRKGLLQPYDKKPHYLPKIY